MRRLQRTNEELQQQVDNLAVQVHHMQNRLVPAKLTKFAVDYDSLDAAV